MSVELAEQEQREMRVVQFRENEVSIDQQARAKRNE